MPRMLAWLGFYCSVFRIYCDVSSRSNRFDDVRLVWQTYVAPDI